MNSKITKGRTPRRTPRQVRAVRSAKVDLADSSEPAPAEPCPYRGCRNELTQKPVDLSRLSPCRRKDHIEIHKAYKRYSDLWKKFQELINKDSTEDPPKDIDDITTVGALTCNLRGFPPGVKPDLKTRVRYCRILGFPKPAEPNPDFAAKQLARMKKKDEAEAKLTWRFGVPLATMKQMKEQLEAPGPLRFCDKKGCNMVETTNWSKEKLVEHNWIHQEGLKNYNEHPAYQWLYDMEAGYYLDGVRAVWRYTEDDMKAEARAKGEVVEGTGDPTVKTWAQANNTAIKDKVIEWLQKNAWEPVSDYRNLDPQNPGTQLLYGRCYLHKESSNLTCYEDNCGSFVRQWSMAESIIGRVNLPGLGSVIGVPEPVQRVGTVRYATSARMPVDEFVHMVVSCKDSILEAAGLYVNDDGVLCYKGDEGVDLGGGEELPLPKTKSLRAQEREQGLGDFLIDFSSSSEESGVEEF